MAAVATPRMTDIGWILDIPPDIAAMMKVPLGSIALLYPKEGSLETEILPPPDAELQAEVDRLMEKYGETFEELKRLGD